MTSDPRTPRPPSRTDAAADAVIDQIVACVRDLLGSDLVGAYLFGSAVFGGLRPRSDIDVLAVAGRPTTRDEKRQLVDRLLHVSMRPRPVELTIVVQDEVQPWRYPPRMDFQYGDWWRSEFERGNLEPWPSPTNPDLASLITMALLADRSLCGPPPTQVLDAVPRADFERAITHGVAPLLQDVDTDTRNVILTLARIWCSLATGVILSKDAAADWALPRLPDTHREVLEHARAIYVGDREEDWDDIRGLIRPHVDHVVAEIARCTPVSPG